MADLDRVVAGLRCRDVLEDLSEFVNGALTADRLARVRLHLADCDVCTRFGGRFAALVEAARRELTPGAPVTMEIAHRLRERLKGEFESS